MVKLITSVALLMLATALPASADAPQSWSSTEVNTWDMVSVLLVYPTVLAFLITFLVLVSAKLKKSN